MIPCDPAGMDEERIVDLSDDEPLLPDSTRDDSVARYDSDTRYDADAGWPSVPGTANDGSWKSARRTGTEIGWVKGFAR